MAEPLVVTALASFGDSLSDFARAFCAPPDLTLAALARACELAPRDATPLRARRIRRHHPLARRARTPPLTRARYAPSAHFADVEMSPMPLNPKQLKFIELYLANGNATQSYIDAGYSKNRDTAEANAARLLGNASIKAVVDSARNKAVEKFPLTYEGALANMWHQATYYGDDATHQARVNATEKVMLHFKPAAPQQTGSSVNVNIAVIPADELRRLIEELEGGVVPAGVIEATLPGGTPPAGELRGVAEVPHSGIQLGLAAPAGDSGEAGQDHGAPD